MAVGNLNRGSVPAPLLSWDATYLPAAQALTASISNVNGVNTVTDCPGLRRVRAVRLAPNGQALYRGTLPAGSVNLSDVDCLYVIVVPRDTNTVSGSLQFAIYLASDAGAITNRREYRGYLQGRAPDCGYVFAVPLNSALSAVAGSGVDGYSASSGTIDMTAVKTVAVQIKTIAAANQGADNYFYVSDIFTSLPRATPKIMLGFDKEFASVRDNALPLLDAAGIKCTLYVSKFEIGNAGRMSLADLQTASSNGHRIALHSYSKSLDLTDTASFPDAQSIANEIAGFEAWAKASGLNYIPHHAAIAIANPWETTASVATAIIQRDGYLLGGLTSWREGNDGFGFRKLNHKINEFRARNIFTTPLKSTTNQTDVETLIQNAADRGAVLSLYAHECLAVPAANDTTPTMVSAIIAKAAAAGVGFTTPATW